MSISSAFPRERKILDCARRPRLLLPVLLPKPWPAFGNIRSLDTGPPAIAMSADISVAPALRKRTGSEPPRSFAVVERQGKSGGLSRQFIDLLAQAGIREKQ